MNPSWQNHLLSSGAVLADGQVAHFGEPERERAAVASGTVLTDLSDRGVIRFSGEDGTSFLQGQLTCDVRQITRDKSGYGGYCTPKGRLLATFLLWQDADGYCLQLPAALVPAIQKRLTLFVLRAKVKIADVGTQSVRLGLAGPGAAQSLQRVYGSVPAAEHEVLQADGDLVIALPGGRYEVVASPDKAPALWDDLRRECTPVGSSWWGWLELKAGIPVILPATQEHFVPQMVNYPAIGGVSFQKGCYPGQEVVARTQYLGKVKRRMYLAHVEGADCATPGDELFSPEVEGQVCGTVANAHPAPSGGCDVLAVIQIAAADSGKVHWKAPDGPTLGFLPLPYPV